MWEAGAWCDLPTASMAALEVATGRREAAGAAALIAMCVAEGECGRLRVSLGAAARAAARRVEAEAAAAFERLQSCLRNTAAEEARAVALSEHISGFFRAKVSPQSPGLGFIVEYQLVSVLLPVAQCSLLVRAGRGRAATVRAGVVDGSAGRD